MSHKFEASFHNGLAYLEFDVNLEKKEGYVHNGNWHFAVLEFKPPYMKIRVLHPYLKSKVIEYHDVAAVKV